MKQRKYGALLIIFFIVSSYIAGFLNLNMKEVFAGNVLGPVEITRYEVKSQIDGGLEVEIGESLDVNIAVRVSGLVDAKVGDTFSITVPDNNYFDYLKPKGLLPDEYDPLLTFEVVGDKIIFTLCKAAEGATDISAYIDLVARAKKDGTGIPAGGDSNETITITTPPEPEYNGPLDVPFQDDGKYLRKDGKQLTGENIIDWSMLINYHEYGKAFDYFTAAKEENRPTDKIAHKTNGMIVDHLAPGTRFRENSLVVTVPTYIITSDKTGGRMGDRQVGANIAGVPQRYNFSDVIIERTDYRGIREPGMDQFKRLTQSEGQSYESFASEVQKYPDQNNGQRVYGVYNHEDGTQTVLIAFGTIPGEKHYYKDLTKDFSTTEQDITLEQAIMADESIAIPKDAEYEEYEEDLQRKLDLIDFYTNPEKSPSGGAIMAYNASFNVDVVVEGDGKYENSIDFIYNEDGKESANWETDFTYYGGGADANFLQVTKELSEGGGNPIVESRKFQFQIVDARNNPIAYGETVVEVNEKGTKFDVKFYKDSSHTEVILNTSDGWSGILTENQWYYIKEVNAEDYIVQIKDKDGNLTNKFRYSSKIHYRWNFVIVNIEPIKVEAKKKVIGEGNIAPGKGEFLFQLKQRTDQENPANDPVVAYGKTTVTSRGEETDIEFFIDDTYHNDTKIDNWKSMTIGGEVKEILKDGQTYYLVEVDKDGNPLGGKDEFGNYLNYEVTYYNGKDENGNWTVEGNDFTANYEHGGKIEFLVDNKDTFQFNANKKVEGTDSLNEDKLFEFVLYEIGEPDVPRAHGKVLLEKAKVEAGELSQSITFYKDVNYTEPVSDWAAHLKEGSSYRLVETTALNYAPSYSGGTGDNQNEFTVVYNNIDENITINVENQNTFNFKATKKVTGDGIFTGETFKFHIIDPTEPEKVLAYGEAKVEAGDHGDEIPITFYTDETKNKEITENTIWADVLKANTPYQLIEVGDSGYAITYTNQDGTETNEFTTAFNTGNTLTINVENRRDSIPLPETGGTGAQQYLPHAIAITLFAIFAACMIEYRRKAGED